MNTRTLGLLTAILIVVTVIWVGTTIATEATAPATDTLADKIASLDSPGALYYVTYVNAALITVFAVAVFAGLYPVTRSRSPLWAVIAVAFVPIYGFGNLVAYLSQIFVVPHLLELHRSPETMATAQVLLGLSLQTWPTSAIAALNLGSYAVLSIPSIIYGVVLAREEIRGLRIAGWLLGISGVLSVLALIGVALNNAALRAMTLLGGAVFLFALIFMASELLRKSTASPRLK